MIRRIIEIEIGCCGECPYYNMKKHKCSKGASLEIDIRNHFYDDCPLNFRELKDGENHD